MRGEGADPPAAAVEERAEVAAVPRQTGKGEGEQCRGRRRVLSIPPSAPVPPAVTHGCGWKGAPRCPVSMCGAHRLAHGHAHRRAQPRALHMPKGRVKPLPVPWQCPATAPASTGSRKKKKSERPGGPQGCSWGRGAMLGILERRAQ